MTRIAATVLIVLIMAALSGPSLEAQTAKTGRIEGCLTEAGTGQPLADAWVAVLENNRGATTDSNGCFAIENLAPGTYTLAVTRKDIGTVRDLDGLKVTVKAGGTAVVSLAIDSRDAAENPRPPADEETALNDITQIFKSTPGINGSGSTGLSEGLVRTPSSSDHSSRVRREKRVPYEAYEAEWDGYRPDPNDMYFRDYGTNDFVDTRRDRYSTFAVDVDDASYKLVREYLLNGHRPPEDAVRVEEFINHFEYGYNVPFDEPFRVFSELSNSPFEPQRQILKLAVKGRETGRYERRPTNITFVIDKSGSMEQGNRFELVRESVRMIVRQLDRRDRVGIVAYGSSAFVVLEPVPADRTRDIFRAIDRLRPGGSTFAEAGIRLGFEMANRQFADGHNNLVILCSDGVANVGRTSPDAIMRQIADWARRGISLSTFGYGMGNYNDVLLEQLALKGDGRYAYINTRDDVRDQFGSNLIANLEVLGRDVKVQVEFNPKIVKSYRLLGYENREVADHRFRDDRQDGGEIFAGHEVTALYEVILARKQHRGRLARVFVRWKNADETDVTEIHRDVDLSQMRDPVRPEWTLAAVAGRFAEMLKGTRYASGTSWSELLRTAEPLRRSLPGEQTDELIDLIHRAADLDGWHAWEERGRYDYSNNYKR